MGPCLLGHLGLLLLAEQLLVLSEHAVEGRNIDLGAAQYLVAGYWRRSSLLREEDGDQIVELLRLQLVQGRAEHRIGDRRGRQGGYQLSQQSGVESRQGGGRSLYLGFPFTEIGFFAQVL